MCGNTKNPFLTIAEFFHGIVTMMVGNFELYYFLHTVYFYYFIILLTKLYILTKMTCMFNFWFFYFRRYRSCYYGNRVKEFSSWGFGNYCYALDRCVQHSQEWFSILIRLMMRATESPLVSLWLTRQVHCTSSCLFIRRR